MTHVLHRLSGRDQCFKSLHELMEAVHRSENADIEAEAACMNDDERQRVCIKVADTVRQLGAKSAIEIAALLYLFETATSEMNRGDFFRAMEKETGIGRTQLYRLIAVHQRFGKILYSEPQLLGLFVCEALKLLSEAAVTDKTRAAAIELARDGTRITIAKARELRRQQAKPEHTSTQSECDDETQPTKPSTSSLASVGRWLWRFEASPISVCVGRTKKNQTISADVIVRALESALEKARQEFATDQTATLSSTTT